METLKLVAGYYFEKGMKQKNVREAIDKFILACDPNASLVLWEKVADSAVRQASKRSLLRIDHIDITKPEMEIIDSLKGRQVKRLAITLLCLSKYWDLCREDNDHWITNKYTDIMAIANIKASVKRQGAMFRELEEAGLLHFPKRVDAISMQVLFVKDGETELSINDFRNVGYQYLKYKGEPFYECAECGIVTKVKNPKNGRPPKYCTNCAAKVRTQQNVNSVMRARNSNPTYYRVYRIWNGMKSRCYSPANSNYERYGGRGITVCDEWLNDFDKFYEWALSNGYQDDLSIDRIDNDGDYSPDNCRWATTIEQANNKSTNVYILYEGRKQTLSQWARELSVDKDTLKRRVENRIAPFDTAVIV